MDSLNHLKKKLIFKIKQNLLFSNFRDFRILDSNIVLTPLYSGVFLFLYYIVLPQLNKINIQIMTQENLQKDLESIKEMLVEMNMHTKEYLNVQEASKFLNLSVSSIYKLTHADKIKYSKPNGKIILFRRSDLVDFIEAGFSTTHEDYLKLADVMIDKTFKKRK